MRYLFFANTPAHVHLYKHAVDRLESAGHEVLVLGRDYGCTVPLLDRYDLPYRLYGKCDTTKGSVFRNLPKQYWTLVPAVRSFDPDLIFGVGAYAAHAGFVSRTPSILILDSEPTSIDHTLSRPFATAFLTPHAFEKRLGTNHYQFTGYCETAYLHPNVYEPNPNIREALGVGEEEPYVILRFNAFGSHHDVGHSGFTPEQRRRLIEAVAEQATVFVSDEGETLAVDSLPARPFDVHPALLHDALASANLVVTDTQTVCTEAALLGTPVIRSNSFVGTADMGNFKRLEHAGLVYNTAEFEEVLSTGRAVLTDDSIGAAWERRRAAYVGDLTNLTDVIVDIAERGTPEGATGVRRWDEEGAADGEEGTGETGTLAVAEEHT
jgi:predicted glycosyltransferase